MVRIVLGAIAGFIAWAIAWVGSEKILSAIWPEWFGAHQTAFEAAVDHGGQFTANTTILLMHMSWPYVPIWYHVIFTAILLPMAIMGGKLITTT